MLFTEVYVSSAVSAWTPDDLDVLLEQSRRKNDALGVTGLLLHRDQSFLQVLEGEEDVVRALYATISRDPRHVDVVNVWNSHSPVRRFPGWSMGFRDLASDPDQLQVPSNADLLRRRHAVPDFLSQFQPTA